MRVILFFDGLTCLQFDIQGGHALYAHSELVLELNFVSWRGKNEQSARLDCARINFFSRNQCFSSPHDSFDVMLYAMEGPEEGLFEVVARWYLVIPIRAYCIKPCLSIPTSISYHNIPARQTFDFQNERVAISQALSLLHDLHKVSWDRQGANIVAVRSIWLANVTWPLK